MEPPRIQGDERGITVNKSLAWTMVGGLLAAGLWLGTQITETKGAIVNTASELSSLARTQTERHAETVQVRRETDARLRLLENSRAADSSEITALRRDLTAFRSDIQDLKTLLRSVENSLGRTR